MREAKDLSYSSKMDEGQKPVKLTLGKQFCSLVLSKRMLTLNEVLNGSNGLMKMLNSGELKNPIFQDPRDGGGTYQARITIRALGGLDQSLWLCPNLSWRLPCLLKHSWHPLYSYMPWHILD